MLLQLLDSWIGYSDIGCNPPISHKICTHSVVCRLFFLIQFFISFWNSQRDWLHFKGIYFSVTVSWRFVLYYFLLMVCHVVFRPFIHLQELQHPCVEQRPWMRRQFSACVTQRRWLPGLGLSAIAERSCYCALCNHALLGECMPVLINDVTVTLC